jgi:RimJ/RimL family protein N-acetyltransferase
MGKIVSEFVPTEEKFLDLRRRLMESPLYLSDELRTAETVGVLLLSHFGGLTKSRFFEIGEWGGLFGFAGIVDGWKADFFFKIWNKNLWGPTMIREIAETIDKIFDEYKLHKLTLMTPDTHMCKFASRHGFEYEGKLFRHFRWNGEYFDTICMAINRG